MVKGGSYGSYGYFSLYCAFEQFPESSIVLWLSSISERSSGFSITQSVVEFLEKNRLPLYFGVIIY